MPCIAKDVCARLFFWPGEIIYLLSRPINLNSLKISACCLLHLPLQNEQEKEYCNYQNNKLKPLTRDMDVWRSDPFGFLQNSKATPIGLDWSKFLRFVADGNIKANGVRTSVMG